MFFVLKVMESFNWLFGRDLLNPLLSKKRFRTPARQFFYPAIGSLIIGFCLQGIAYGEEKKAAGSVLSELHAQGLDPRWSRIFPDTLAAKALLSPVIRELPPTTEPREVRLSGRRAVVSPNIRMHPSSTTTQSEMSIVTHPLNPEVVLAGANAVHVSVSVGSQGWYHTTDGGANWLGGDTLPTHSDLGLFMADPAVGIDLDGNLFFNALLYGGTSDVIVARSTDNGTSWSQTAVPRDTGGFRDKNHFAADLNPGNPYENYLYTAYTDFGPLPGPVMFSRSSDRGVSFSAPTSISGSIGSEFAQGINLAVGPNSELYAAWSGYDVFPPVTTHLGFNKSTDGGATWQGAVSIRDVFDIRGQLNKGGNFVRVNSFPSMAVDRSGGPRHGWIYIVYPEKNPTTPDIFLIRSTDGGSTWSAPHKVNQDVSGKDQWFSWVSVDPVTGHLYVVYYDSRNFPANDSAQVFISSSADGGDTFEDLLVSDVAFLPTPIPGLAGGYMGDYIGISARNGVVWPCWNDNRTGIHQGYTSRVVFLEVGSPPKISVSPDSLDFETVFLGYPETLSVSVRNLGFPETLQVSNIVSDNPSFTPETTTLLLPGGSVQKLKVAFNPSATGLVTAALTITSNDTANPIVTVILKGEGLVAPDISVSPDSFRVDLFTGDVAIETLTIANTGGSNLNFDISIGEQTALVRQVRPLRLQPLEKTQLPAYKPLRTWQDYGEAAKGNGNLASAARAVTLVPPLPVVITDPAGDGAGVDITLLRGSGGSGQLQIQMELSTTIVPTNFGGYLSLDIDQNPATGVPPSFGNGNQDIGAEYEFLLFSLGSGIVNLYNAVTGTFVGSYSIVIGTNTLTFSTPLADLGNDDEKMDATGVIGDAFGPTDWFPDSGHGTIGALDFLAVNPGSGTVPPGFSLDVEVTFDATGIPGGHFFADLLISSNDPDENVDTVPTHLHVIGAPNIVLSDDTLDFGDAFIGYPDTLILTVFNDGTDLLEVTGMTIDNPRFSVLDATVFNVPPGDSQNVRASFLPLAVGPDSGILSIASTDSTDSIVTVQLLGSGLIPPDISVSPDSLEADLFTGEMVVETLTIANTGGSDLIFDISLENAITLSAKVKTINLFRNSSEAAAAARPNLTPLAKEISADVLAQTGSGGVVWSLPARASAATVPASVLLLTTTSVAGSVGLALNNLGVPYDLVQTDDFTGIDFSLYATIIVTMDGGLIEEIDVQALANAASSGKKLIMIGGTDYSPYYNGMQLYFLSHTSQQGWMVSAAPHLQVSDPSHPLSAGLPSPYTFTNSSAAYYMLRVNDSLAEVAAINGDGFPDLMNKEIGSGLLIYFLNSPYEFYWANPADFAILQTVIENALAFSIGPSWLSVNPDSGIVPAGSSAEIEVTLDAVGLSGGDYFANLLVSSNDPDEPVDTTPAHLHVTGAPDIAVSDTLLDFDSVFTGFFRAETLVVSNEGTDLLTVSDVSSDNTAFTVSVDSFSLTPGGSRNVPVTFTPGDTGLFTGQLTLASNDPDEPSVAVLLQGVGIYPPVMEVSPDSFAFTLPEGDSATATLTIRNNGLGNLNFALTNDFSPASLRAARLGTPSMVRNEKIINPYETAAGEKIQQAFPVQLGPQAGSLAASVPPSSGQRLFGAGGGGISEIDLSTGTVLNSYPTPVPTSDGPTALAFSGSKLYFTDAFTTLKIYVLDPNNGGALDSFPAPSPFIDGLAFINGKLYAQDYDASLLYELTADSGRLLRTISPPVIIGGGLDGSSGRLFASNFSGAIYELSPLDGSVLNSFAPITAVYGLGFTGRRLFATVPGVGIDEYDPNTGTYLGRISTLGFAALAGGGVDWLSEVPTGGTVAPGESQEVQVTVRTDQLDGGFFRANILVSGNDPVNPEDTVPVSLRVIGVPNIVLSDDTLNFGDVFVSYPDTLTLTVSNNGSDLLEVTSITSNNPHFSVLDPAVFNVLPGDSQNIRVQFLPTQVGPDSGRFAVTSSDSIPPADSLVILLGNGIHTPQMEVSPDSFAFILNQEDSATAALTIANAGPGTLSFSIEIQSAGSARVPLARLTDRPEQLPRITGPIKDSRSVIRGGSSDGEPGFAMMSSYLEGAVGPKVLLLAADEAVFASDVSSKLLATGRFSSVDIMDVRASTPNLVQLQQYDAVLVWSNYAFFDPIALGNVLADYVDAGGGVVTALFAMLQNASFPNQRIRGRFDTQNYWAIQPADFQSGSQATLGTIHVPGHPTIQNVNSFNGGFGSFRLQGTVPAAGATLVASWSSGEPLVAVKSVNGKNRVDLGFFPPSSDAFPDFWLSSTDGAVMMANALEYVFSPAFVSVTPGSGTVAPGGSVELEVKVLSDQLPSGTYRALILVSGDDPTNRQDTVPVQITVVGCAAAKGDMNGDSMLTITDVVLNLNCVFLNEGMCSLCFADLNCDGQLAPADVVLELNAVFLGRPFPCL